MCNCLKISILTFVVVVFFSCSEGNKQSSGKVFRYNESKGVVSLDPAFARNQATLWPVAQIYNGLLQTDDSLHVLPCIASSYSISSDGKTYTFKIRNDVYFHDHPVFLKGQGRRVVASDFVYSFNRLIDPNLASPGAWALNILDKSKGVNGVKAVNDSLLIIYLKSSFSPFPGLLTMPYCFVVPHEIVEHYGRDFRSNPVGTGPFYLKLWVEGEKMVLRKNEKYFETDSIGEKLPKVDAVAITFIADKQSEFLEFMKGRIDFISGINASFKDELITMNGQLQPKYADKLKMLRSPYLNTEYLGIMIDSSKMPTNQLLNKALRLALNLAIDRRKLTSYLRNNIGTPATAGFVPKGLPSFSEKEVRGYNYNPDSARILLQKAGFPNAKGLFPLKITTVSDYLDICEFVQNEWAQIGVEAEIEVVTGLAYREMLANSKMQIFRASWVADYADAENYLALFYGPNFAPQGPNYTHFNKQKFNELYNKAQSEVKENERFRYYRQMDQLIIDEAVVIPLFYDEAIRFTNKRVKNLGINPLNLLSLKYVEVE